MLLTVNKRKTKTSEFESRDLTLDTKVTVSMTTILKRRGVILGGRPRTVDG